MKTRNLSLLALGLSLLGGLVAPAIGETFNWTGALSTDYQTAGNWTTNGVVAEQVPCDGADVVIDAGTGGITASLDVNGCDYASVTIGPNFGYSVGNSTSDCLIFAANKLVVYGGGGAGHWLQAASPGWDEVIVRSVGPTGLGPLFMKGTSAGTVNIKKGTVTLGSGLAITTLVVDPTAGSASNVVLTSSATVTTAYLRSGTNTLAAGTVTTTYLDSGVLTNTGATQTNLVQRGGSTVWKTTATMTSGIIFAGTFDASQDVRPKTITNLQTHTGATALLDNAIGNITLTNGVKVYAGTVSYPSGELVQY